MTEISFYHLTTTPLGKALPQLLLKVLETGNRAVLLAKDKEQVKLLDTLLWTFSTNKLVPHGTSDDGFIDEQPVYLTTSEENPNNASILVSTGGQIPSYINNFSRFLDIFDGNNPGELQSARSRWTVYKDKNYSLTYWKQTESGGWEKA